jgi:anti-sigma-K factor RskA
MMDAEEDDKEVLAAEYVLGTLDPNERAQAQALSALDSGFAAIVRAWERRLGELNVLIAPVEPPPETWERVKARMADVEPSGEFQLPTVQSEPAAPPPTVEVEAREPDTARLRRSIRRWRRATLWVFLLVAALAAICGIAVVRELRPEYLQYLPPELRPKLNMQVVEVTNTVEIPSPKPAQFIAVLQKDAFAPAFLLTFDLDKRILAVRTVGAPRQAGKSYQLWLNSPKFSSPRSLGVIGSEEFTMRPQLAAYDPTIIYSATYSVSLEPEGGSPTGVPTGPTLYSGKLIQTTPVGFGDQTP